MAEAFGLGWDDLEAVAVNGAEAAFAPFEERRRLVDEVLRPAYRALASGDGGDVGDPLAPSLKTGHSVAGFEAHDGGARNDEGDRLMPGMPGPVADEREGLLAYLAQQRYVIRLTAYGLTDEQVRATPIPSTSLSVGGLVKHAARMEQGWIDTVLERQRPGTGEDDYVEGFRLGPGRDHRRRPRRSTTRSPPRPTG